MIKFLTELYKSVLFHLLSFPFACLENFYLQITLKFLLYQPSELTGCDPMAGVNMSRLFTSGSSHNWRGTWRISSCSRQLSSPVLIAEAAISLEWFILINKVLWPIRRGFLKFIDLLDVSWQLSQLALLIVQCIAVSLLGNFSTRSFLGLKQGKNIDPKVLSLLKYSPLLLEIPIFSVIRKLWQKYERLKNMCENMSCPRKSGLLVPAKLEKIHRLPSVLPAQWG